jgi:hypothetical protein
MAEPPDGEHRDELPADLDVTAYVGRYTFPDIRRRRTPAYVYLAMAAVFAALWATHTGERVLVNGGFLGVAVFLALLAAYHIAAAWPLAVRDTDALVAAAREVGFPVGHASAQLGWRGLRSRPTWRILLYSGEDPPTRRGLVLVDGVDGEVLDHFVEDNPEDWSQYGKVGGPGKG